MGAHKISRSLLALCCAAIFLSLRSIWSWFSSWQSTKTIDDLYGALYWALGLVVVGVIVEEWKLLWHILKFMRYTWNGKFRHAVGRARAHGGEIAEGLGFIILVIGLAAEMVLDPSIESAEKANAAKAAGEIATANTTAAEANWLREI
jgi:hypothetical protein